MARILTTIGCYLPGYKAGGPIRSVSNLIDALGDEFEFFVVTADRDLGEDEPYANVVTGAWQSVGKAKVLYLPPAKMGLVNWCRFLNSNFYDLLYLNSFFSRLTIKTLFLRALGLIPNKATVVAPRGEFSTGALSMGKLKKLKKRLYIHVAGALNFYRQIVWQASSEREALDILAQLGNWVSADQVFVAPNIAAVSFPRTEWTHDVAFRDRVGVKRPGFAKVVFLSRIARMKNLEMAIELLGQTKGEVEFDIYGPLEDEEYWGKCCDAIRKLPANVRVSYKGVVAAEEVHTVFSHYHAFLFPTHGENFGHVILEALGAGCLVLTSDRTPWQDFEKDKIGWVLSLNEANRFVDAMNEVIDMGGQEFEGRSNRAIEFAQSVATDQSVLEANDALFNQALTRQQYHV
jgi:glycosyltransferase involved in cell wall biosynthesis